MKNCWIQNMKKCWIRGAFQNRQTFLHFVLSEPSPVSGGYPIWWVKDQCWVLLWDSQSYMYITGGSHFLKTLASEPNWKTIFLWYSPLEPTRKQVLWSKNLAKNRERTAGSFMKTIGFLGFWNIQNWPILSFWFF